MDDSGLGKYILDKLEKLDDKLDNVRVESAESRKTFDAHEQKDENRHRDIKKMGNDIMNRLGEQTKSLDEYNKQLEIHIEGVNTLKKNQIEMWKRTEPVVLKHENETAAKKWLSDRMKTRVKWVTAVGAVAGSIATVLKLLGMI